MAMSIRKLLVNDLIHRRINVNFLNLVVHYSRRRDPRTTNGPYKIVKARESVEEGSLQLEDNKNWELLAPRGYAFYMPGGIGPAWQNAETSISFHKSLLKSEELNVPENNLGFNRTNLESFDRFAEECPLVLRKGVSELFSGNFAETSYLTLITLKRKLNIRKIRLNREAETEKIAKNFVLAAQHICYNLNSLGYWADFINPFSGRPYISNFYNISLYNTDERFRCMDFQIIKQHNCKIIVNEMDMQIPRTFIGSLFTSAPYNITYLQQITNNLK